jgi:hypothetical protein
MGGYSASSENVVFAYDEALQAARDLTSLGSVVTAKQEARATEAGLAVDGWEGGHRDAFDTRMTPEGSDAATVADGLAALAGLFASRWAEARGEQDRINFARYVQHEKDEDSWGENAGEWVVGEDDYGAPPEDPPVPEGPEFAVTRDPIHPEFEHTG